VQDVHLEAEPEASAPVIVKNEQTVNVAAAEPSEPARRQRPGSVAPRRVPAILPLSYSGSFFTRYELREGYQEHGLGASTQPRLHREGDTFVYRARFGVETEPARVGKHSVGVKFVPQAHGTHSTGGTPTTSDSYDLRVHEAFIRVTGSGFRLDVGRFAMDYGDALVIGQSNWAESGRAFQGGRFRLTAPGNEQYFTDVFATLISEGSLASNAAFSGDQYFYGIYTSLGKLGSGPSVDAYLLGRTWVGASNAVVDGDSEPVTADQEGATHLTLGGRAAQSIDVFDYRLEAGIQFGQSPALPGAEPPDHLAFQIDGAAGVSIAHGLRVALGGTATSGDDDPSDDVDRAWDELFPTGHASLGYTDVIISRSDILSGNVELSYQANDSLLLRAKAYALARFVEDPAGNRYVGTEVDTDVIHTLVPGATLRGSYSIFVPDADTWGAEANAQRGDPIHLFEAQLGYEF
jgi:hypothetical protein